MNRNPIENRIQKLKEKPDINREAHGMISMIENPLYQMHELHHVAMSPINFLANASKLMHSHPFSLVSYTGYGRTVSAASELLQRATNRYPKPEFGITETTVAGKAVKVTEEIVAKAPFCRLLHFKKEGKHRDAKVLLVAPMSGHHPTLLRGTVEALLPHTDVYITDWADAKTVPTDLGKFSLDTYIDYVINYVRLLGPAVHLIAVCQPSVPVLAAVAAMAMKKDPAAPRSMTLIGGPVDTREGVTKVNELAVTKPMSWFESQVITRVPYNYPGFMRRVFPGFLQLTGFMSMNIERHVGEHIKLFQHLVAGDGDSAEAHRKFYNEYLSVADLPAEFYLDTIDKVFKRHLLPKGKFDYRGKIVDPGAITKTALLTIEGELDDISGVGQTKAAMGLCKNLPAKKKKYHLQAKVGHYGLFNGRRFREKVLPVILDFIKTHG